MKGLEEGGGNVPLAAEEPGGGGGVGTTVTTAGLLLITGPLWKITTACVGNDPVAGVDTGAVGGMDGSVVLDVDSQGIVSAGSSIVWGGVVVTRR